MTKKEALAEFKEYYLPGIVAREQKGTGRADAVMRAEEWNNYTDQLCKERRITASQYHNWSNPF